MELTQQVFAVAAKEEVLVEICSKNQELPETWNG
jgi:hypothetical protein